MKKTGPYLKRAFVAIFFTAFFFFPNKLPASTSGVSLISAQDQSTIFVKGVVRDEATGEGLPGVSVAEKGTSTGVITDFDGNYNIGIQRGGLVVFSYVGFKSQEKKLVANSTLDIFLQEDLKHLEELVVVGYTTQKKADLTGAVSSVDMSKLGDVPAGGINSALQGRMSGVTVLQSSGAPGASASIRIRGMGTFGNNDPLYVIDGLPAVGMTDLNPSDIERVDVLKDAASAAIYGSRAANGVVLIQTKRGVASEKVNVSFSTYHGVSTPQKKMKVLSAAERNGIHYEAYQNAIDDGNLKINSKKDPRAYYSSEEAQLTRTHWQDEIFNSAAYQGNYDLNLSGGSKTAKYSITAGHLMQDGVLRNTSFNRTNLRINTELMITKNFKVGENLLLTHSDRASVPDAGSYAGAIGSALLFDPAISVYEDEEKTKYSGAGPLMPDLRNPRAIVDRADKKYTRNRVFGNVYAEYRFLKDFSLKTDFGYDWFYGQGKEFFANFPEQGGGNKGNELTQSVVTTQKWINTTTLKFEKTMEKHYLMAVAGRVYESYKREYVGGKGIDFVSEAMLERYLSACTDISSLYGGRGDWAMEAYFGRVDYAFDSRYLLSANFRADASSKFIGKNRWGYFPSLSLGWRLSEEAFFEPLKATVSNLKLRASWGVLGNQNIHSNYPAKQIVESISTGDNGYYVVFGKGETATTGRYLSNLPNPDIKWEMTTQKDFGIDISLFDKLHLELDFFDKLSSDVLIQIPLPSLAGVTEDTWQNAARVRNRGFDANLSYATQISGLSLRTFANIGLVRNKVLNLSNKRSMIFTRSFAGHNIAKTVPNEPMSFYFGYQTDGIFHTQEEIAAYKNEAGELYQKEAKPGDLKFIDVNGDGKINDDDKTNLGNGFPDFSYGFGLELEYKGFDLNCFFQGVAGYTIFNALKYNSMFVDPRLNQYAAIMGRFHPVNNPNGKLPRVIVGEYDKNNNRRMSDYYIEKGDYLRLKTLTIGYSFDKRVVRKLKLQKLRAYVTMQNIFTFTNYSGFDPELSGGFDNGAFPQTKSIIAGFNVNF